MKRILLTISDEMYQQIKEYQQERKLNTTEYIRIAIFMQVLKDARKKRGEK